MPSKLGVHIVQGARTGYGDYLRRAHAAGTPVPLVKTIDDYAPLKEAEEISPKTVTIFRTFKEGDTPPGNFTGVPEAVAAAWMEGQLRHWRLGGADYFEPINEPAPASLDGYRWLNDFSLACMRIAEHNGYRLCLYNFAGGVPGDDPPGQPGGASAVDKFRVLLPSLRHALDNNHALGLHSYGLVGSGTLKESANTSALHYRAFYTNVLEPSGLGKLKLFITEAAPFGGHEWDRQGKEAFLEDVFWHDREVRNDPYLIGVALFTLGNWAKANFQEALPDIAQHFGTVAGAADPRYDAIVVEVGAAPPTVPARVAAQSDWQFIADITIPDGSRFPPGAPLEKLWRVKNTGGTTWDERFQLRFASGEPMGGPGAIPLKKTEPGQELDIKVNLVAPTRPDHYASYWKLYDVNGIPFGTTVWLDIVVADDQALPVADGFHYPVGNRVNLEGWFDAQPFLTLNEKGEYHPGADLNDSGWGDHDLGSPVYAIGPGRVVFSGFREIWGNIVLIEHVLPGGAHVWSQYAHLNERLVHESAMVARGDKIGTVGKGDQDRYWAHLHFEIRRNNLDAGSWQVKNRDLVKANYYDPIAFIRDHLALPDVVVTREPVVTPVFGIHNEDGGDWMVANGMKGWCVHTVALGPSANATRFDFTRFQNAGIRTLVRLNYAHNLPHGTIPDPDDPAETERFINAVVETMQQSVAVAGYVLSNEPNNPNEFPNNKPITPQQYAAIYNRVWMRKPPSAFLAPAAVDPYYGPDSDNRQWWQTMLNLITGADFLTIHCKTQDSDPAHVSSGEKFSNDPLTWQFFHLRAYQPLLEAVPPRFRHLAVHATEVNPQRHNDMQKLGWQEDQGAAWVAHAAQHFRTWNATPGTQKVHGVIFYRFSADDWGLQTKPSVLDAIRREA